MGQLKRYNRRKLSETVGEENIEAVADMYVKAYAGTGMTAEEIWEECVCDSLGDINIFASDATMAGFVGDMQTEIKAEAESQVKETSETRGPPESEAKASRETVDDYGLTDEEIGALLAYKSGGSYSINAKLREGIKLNAYEQKIADTVNKALRKLPKHKGHLYRNIGFDSKSEMDRVISEHIIGGFIGYEAFISTSTEKSGYNVYSEYPVHFEIESFTGRNLEGVGNNFESEVLFHRDTSFIVNDITYDNSGTPTIYLTEVAYEQETVSTGRTEEAISVNNRGQQKVSSESNESEVQRLQKENQRNSTMRNISERDSKGNMFQQGDLQGVRTEIEESNAKFSRELDFVDYLNENPVVEGAGENLSPDEQRARAKSRLEERKAEYKKTRRWAETATGSEAKNKTGLPFGKPRVI